MFFMSAAAAPAAHALGEACGSSNPPCPSDLVCDKNMNVCVPPLTGTPDQAAPVPKEESTPNFGGTISPTQSGGTGSVSSGSNVTLINPLKGGGNVESFLQSILAIVIRIGAIIVILMLVYVGYLFVIAQGEPGKISEARQMLLWTVVGALILLGSQAIAVGIKATVQALSTG